MERPLRLITSGPLEALARTLEAPGSAPMLTCPDWSRKVPCTVIRPNMALTSARMVVRSGSSV